MELPWSYHGVTMELPWSYHGINSQEVTNKSIFSKEEANY
jgi:hypothetical protein